MSVTRFRLSLVILACIALGIAVVGWVIPTVFAERDGWDLFSPITIEAEPLFVEPHNLLTAGDKKRIQEVLLGPDDYREFGIPWSIAVVSDATLEPGISPENQAQAFFEEAGIESAPGADDGLLMYVVVPEADHTETSVHFVTGENFYPRGGITPEQLRWIADVQMAPIIADNSIGAAVLEGATWVEWMQLFEPPPDPAPTTLQEGLHRILHPLGAIVLGGLALLVGAAGVAVAMITRRGTGSASPIKLDPVRAGALATGRVDHRIISGTVIDVIDRGALADSPDGLIYSKSQRVRSDTGRPQNAPAEGDQIDSRLVTAVDTLHEQGVTVTPASLAQYLRSTDLRRVLEDELASTGSFHPRSHRFEVALRILAITGTLAGILALVLSVVGEVGSTLVAAIPLTAISIAVLIWNEFRGWTTSAGRVSLAQWLERHEHQDDRARQTFEAIRGLDDVPVSFAESASVGANRRNLLKSLHYQG